MTPQTKATQLSLVVHALVVLGVLLFSRYAEPETPLVIDFSLAIAESAHAGTGPPPGPEAPQPQAAPAPEQPPEPKKKPVKAPPKVAKKKPAKQVQTPPKQEPRPEPAPEEATAQTETAQDALQAEQGGTAGTAAHAGAGQTAAGGQPTGSGDGGGGLPYSYEYVRRLIMKHLTFPATARRMGLSGKVVVSFLLKKDGRAEDIAIVVSSGHEILDTAVVATIRSIVPFPKPPAPAHLTLPIVFNLRK